jgi:hypothetical protein
MASRRRRLDPVGPFGNPDGSRADIEDLISEFVDFGGNPAYGHLATRANDSMVRVIVGKLGIKACAPSSAERLAAAADMRLALRTIRAGLFPRWYSTALRLMNSSAAISGFDSPFPTRWATSVSRLVSTRTGCRHDPHQRTLPLREAAVPGRLPFRHGIQADLAG